MPIRLSSTARYNQRRRYYQKHAINCRNSREPWTNNEDKKVLEHILPDTKLAKIIGRSVGAIQIHRVRLKKR